MNGVPFSEKQFRKVRTILAGDAGDKRRLWISIHQLTFRLAPISEGYRSHKDEPRIDRTVSACGTSFRIEAQAKALLCARLFRS
jgi:hypothetical protein